MIEGAEGKHASSLLFTLLRICTQLAYEPLVTLVSIFARRTCGYNHQRQPKKVDNLLAWVCNRWKCTGTRSQSRTSFLQIRENPITDTSLFFPTIFSFRGGRKPMSKQQVLQVEDFFIMQAFCAGVLYCENEEAKSKEKRLLYFDGT